MKLTWLAGFASAIFVLLLSSTISADVYVYKDKEGVLNFTRVPCTEEEQGCARVVPARQWEWRDDINGDGKVTISDVDGWIKWIFSYQGDWLIYTLLNDKNRGVAEFFELTPNSYGSWGSLGVSLMLWCALLGGAVNLAEEIPNTTDKYKKQVSKWREWWRIKLKRL
jgi:hypothetical protein